MSEHTQTHNEVRSEDHSEGSHAVPFYLLVLVGGALLVLTWVTVAVAQVDLGSLNLAVALGVATVKASLVCLYFMHLRWDNPFNAFIFIFSIVCVALFIFFTLIDTTAYQEDLIPYYAPSINQ